VLTDYREELLKHWATDDSRVLGHVLYSPPMDVDSTSGYARDVAVIAVDLDKVDPASFPGNMIDLGGEYKLIDLVLMMTRNPKNVHEISYHFFSRQLGLRGIVPKEEMRKPVDYDEDGNPCIGVLMRGATSGLKWQFDVTYVTPVGAVLDFVKAGKGLEGAKMRKGPDKETLRKLPF